MSDKLGTFIVMLIQTVVFLTPMLLLFYRQGRKDQTLDEAIKDISGLGKKVSEIRDAESQSLSELKSKFDSVERTLVEVTTSIRFMTKSIEELKDR